MNKKIISESEKNMYEYVANKYFKKLHIYIEVNVDKDKPRRTEIETIRVFRDEKKCIKFGKSRKEYINKYNDDSDWYSIHQYYEDVELED